MGKNGTKYASLFLRWVLCFVCFFWYSSQMVKVYGTGNGKPYTFFVHKKRNTNME